MDAASIREIQTLLKELGYLPGPIDGITGPLTRKAIHDYHWAKGLGGSDEPSPDLLARLRLEAAQKR
jgi:peptidoglycan hydrolase-like protein with peptidoglycan-binding domain